MTEPRHLKAREPEEFLASACVDPAVSDLRPDYRVLLIAVDGITEGGSDQVGELLVQAETVAAALLANTLVEDVPHVAAWRETYRAFGAKPQRTRNSLEALLRRSSSGLPRVNTLTDVYNALSIIHQVPLGGEDLHCYNGPPQLVRADGTEDFDTVADGEAVIEHPEPGEVVWRDATAVTCRRWNWRQGRRTQLTPQTTSALFLLDALAPMSDQALADAGDELINHLRRLGPDVRVATRVLSTAPSTATTAQENP